MFPWGVFGCNCKVGPLERSENCVGLSGWDDKLMTHLLLETEGTAGFLLVDLEVVVLVIDLVDIGDDEILAVEPLVVVVVVVVVAGPDGLLFPDRTTFLYHWVKSLMGGNYPYLVADYDGIMMPQSHPLYSPHTPNTPIPTHTYLQHNLW